MGLGRLFCVGPPPKLACLPRLLGTATGCTTVKPSSADGSEAEIGTGAGGPLLGILAVAPPNVNLLRIPLMLLPL
jgi:hypothetical protein